MAPLQLQIEEYSLNAWPALQTLVYDGWLLRFADGYTKRSNSVNALYNRDEERLERKIAKCEELYAKAGLPTVFKVTSFGPPSLDRGLESRGYTLVDPSCNMFLEDLDGSAKPLLTDAEVFAAPTSAWLETLARLNPKLSEHDLAVTAKMLSGTVLQTGCFTLYEGAVPVACGIGVIEDHMVGLFDIVTSEQHRNRGYGEQLIRNILRWAKENGATQSYLQVLQHNPPAHRLYEKLGYRQIYSYWYRVKRLK
ncbi:GNAT family N-acetyltransferase [Paenibacillus cookii]|uniref:GNAT family N-acetyltransferase n=1 Tax=Paenibacillus cookii TaxID=157839 RepID=UPI001FE5F8DA|nr:GNAT family N-acetyltransferase [Paenibacillus cookii]